MRGVGNPQETSTRTSVVTLLLEDAPISASEVGSRLGLSAAGVRRHIDVLIDQGKAAVASPSSWRQRGPGRPAKLFQLTSAGRAELTHAYDDLAGAAMRQLREIGGDAAVAELARKRITDIVGTSAEVPADLPEDQRLQAVAQNIADSLTKAGYAASTRTVGSGVQICQHHCPVSHVAAEFPELCEAEREAFQQMLGTHIQQLATIANGDSVCTTHVPLGLPS